MSGSMPMRHTETPVTEEAGDIGSAGGGDDHPQQPSSPHVHSAWAREEQAAGGAGNLSYFRRRERDRHGPAAFALDADGVIVAMTPDLEQLIGWPARDAVGKLTALAWLDPGQLTGRAQQAGTTVGPHILQQHGVQPWALTRRDGSQFDALLSCAPLEIDVGTWLVVVDPAGRPVRGQPYPRDRLTGLAGRRLLLERLDSLLANPADQGIAVYLLDLDGFRLLNGSLGVHVTDEVLRVVADRLRNFARPGDLVARVGADEFAIAVSGGDVAREGVHAAVRRIERLLAAPIHTAEHEVHVTCCIGVTVVREPRRPRDPEDILRDAEVALILAQEKGQGSSQVFDEQNSNVPQRRVRADSALRAALAEDRLQVHYQPIIDLSSGSVVGVEALLRLRDPQRGLLGPAPFVAAAEESGLIVQVGRWVLEQACREAASWSNGGEMAKVSVNLSARQLNRPDLMDTVVAVLERSGLQPDRLVLELTETALGEAGEETIGQLARLRGIGVHLAIDDFGTGWSSLTYLRRFPVTSLKVDRSFVAGVADDSGDRAIVTAVVRLGQALDLTTVAEGVETAEQLAVLREIGCEQAQGFHLARPARTPPF